MLKKIVKASGCNCKYTVNLKNIDQLLSSQIELKVFSVHVCNRMKMVQLSIDFR